jgi:hypothetical protein
MRVSSIESIADTGLNKQNEEKILVEQLHIAPNTLNMQELDCVLF